MSFMNDQKGSVVLGDVVGTVGTAGAVATAAAVLPNTAGNTMLTVLSYATIVVGALVFSSFVVTRVLSRYYSR